MFLKNFMEFHEKGIPWNSMEFHGIFHGILLWKIQ
jgi:hypothetical protein